MDTKIAFFTHLPEHQECTSCHSVFTDKGYILRDGTLSRFVCEECYSNISSEYSVVEKVVEIDRRALNNTVPENKKPDFQAGYLLGKVDTEEGSRITVSSFIKIEPGNRGTVNFFSGDDVTRIRKASKEKECSLVGIFRTSPSGSPDFNSLDYKILEDMLFDIVYMIIGGNSEIQIAVKDKSFTSNEIGVIIV